MLAIEVKCKPRLEPEFIPAVLWNRAFRKQVEATGTGKELIIAVEQPGGSVTVKQCRIFPSDSPDAELNLKYVERIVKCLLWMSGGNRIYIAGEKSIADQISSIYAPAGKRKFDFEIMGSKMFREPMEVIHCRLDEVPADNNTATPLGRNLAGCRIGFDLGGSDRKCAAVIDGKVVFSEEIAWDPYFQSDPQYHKTGISASLERAAAHLPRVDAIGGSAAGDYIDNQVRVASLFRGITDDDFEQYVINIFNDLKKEWEVPFIVINDGEVTALAGSMEMNANSVLGLSMGTSMAAGYVDGKGHITDRLNEFAFVPIDFRDDAPIDEWSGDIGCGVQYFSQQGVARLAPLAGLKFQADMPFAEQLVEIQQLMANDDVRARSIYETIGTCFGYAIAHYAEFYEFENLLILGRVTTGKGGDIILEFAQEVLKVEFPDLAAKITFHTPDEKNKRHGQAVAAASLPKIING